jgi:hypothetical protein
MDRNATPSDIIRGLASTLDRIEAVSGALTAAQLRDSPDGTTWSPNQVLWHIRACADVHEEHIKRIINEHEPRWRHVSPRARMKKSRYDLLPFAESLAAFAQQRRDFVALLSGLAPEAWRRVALVKVAHRPGEDWRPSLHAHAWGMADHEAGHCRQMEEIAGRITSTPG